MISENAIHIRVRGAVGYVVTFSDRYFVRKQTPQGASFWMELDSREAFEAHCEALTGGDHGEVE